MDPFVLLTPILVLGVVALFGFVGCDAPSPGNGFYFEKPALPPFLNAVAGDERVYLFWDSAMGIDTHVYEVRRGTSKGGPYSLVTSLPASARSFTDRSLVNGTEYFYVVRAAADGFHLFSEEEADSSEVSATPAPLEARPYAEGTDIASGETVSTLPLINVRASSLMVVWVWYKDPSVRVLAVTDSLGNEYLPVADPVRGQGNFDAFQQEIWYLGNVNGGADVVVTATFSAQTNEERNIVAHEYSGLHPSDPLDQTAHKVAAFQNASTDPITSTDAVLIFGAAIFDGAGNAAPGFVQQSDLGGNVTEWRRADASGTVQATFGNAPEEWIAQMVSFK